MYVQEQSFLVQAREGLGKNTCKIHDERLLPFRIPFRLAKALCHATPSFSRSLTRITEILPSVSYECAGTFSCLNRVRHEHPRKAGRVLNERSRYNATAQTGLISQASSFNCQSLRCASGPRKQTMSRLGSSAALGWKTREATATDGQSRQAGHLSERGEGWLALAQAHSGQ